MTGEDRTFALTEVESKADLLERLRTTSWPLCTAFQLGELIFANSSRRAQGPQEFAVIRDGQQIEALRLNRMTPQALQSTIDWLLAGGETFMGIVELITEPASAHSCPLCQ